MADMLPTEIRIGWIFRYAYLWDWQRRQGRGDGDKDRPYLVLAIAMAAAQAPRDRRHATRSVVMWLTSISRSACQVS